MSPAETDRKWSNIKLLPHQITLVNIVLDPASTRAVLLRGDVGLGKSTALVAIARRLLKERPMARVLFLAPRTQGEPFVEMLHEGSTPALLLDRYKFRELLDSSTLGSGDQLWPQGVVVVLSWDFAKQPDVLNALARARWDLVVADEVHNVKLGRAKVLRRVEASAERIVFVSAPVPDRKLSGLLPQDITVVEWRPDQLIDHAGRLLSAAPRPILHEIPFRWTEAELGVREAVKHLTTVLPEPRARRLLCLSMLRTLQSSPAALEGILRRFRERSLERFLDDRALLFFDEEFLEDDVGLSVSTSATDNVERLTNRALEIIDNVAVDSKLNALGALLTRIIESKTPHRRICILTDYVGTLFYLAAEIECRGIEYLLIHGGTNPQDRQRSLTAFADTMAVLVATRAIVTNGLTSLRETTDLVLYDIPISKIALRNVLARFDRFDTQKQLNVYALAPSEELDITISEPLRFLREVINDDSF